MLNRQSLINSLFPKYMIKPRPVNVGSSAVSRVAIIVGGLMFTAVTAYGGAGVWTEAAILAIIFNLAAELNLRRRPQLDPEIKRLLAPIFALAAYSFIQGLATLASLGGNLKYAAFLPDSFDLTASFWCALKFLALALFIKTLLVNFRANLRLLIWSLMIAGNFFAVLGIVRFLLQASFPESFGWFILPELRPGTGFGTFLNQNHFAFLMLMNLGLSIGLGVHGNLENHQRVLALLFSILSWIAVILTASRGGIISSLLVIVVSIFLPGALYLRKSSKNSGKKRPPQTLSTGRTLAGILALAIFAVVGVVLIGQDRVLQRFEEIPAQLESAPEADAFSRPDVWQASAAMINRNAFFGVGFGGFRYAVAQYIDISGEVVPQQAHNDYLEFAASGGIVAILCGVWFLTVLFSLLKKRLAEPAARFECAARFGAIGAFAGIAVHNFFDFGLQFIANWLFLAALLSVAVHKNETDEPKMMSLEAASLTTDNQVKRRTFRAIGLLILSFLCLFYGFSRLENSLAGINPSSSDLRNNILKLPFDADFYETGAIIGENTGNLEAASENLSQAIYYRPKDYVLWLKLAKTRELLGQNEAAETAFRQALALAPFYGEPYFAYGNFLVRNNRTAEGFSRLHFAFERNPRYFDKVFALALKETSGSAGETIKLLMPLDLSRREKLAELLFARSEYAAITEIACREEDLSLMKRGEMIIKLLEKRRFRDAFQIHLRNCDPPDKTANNLLNGDFEKAQLEKNLGFGWRSENLPETVKIGFDNKTFLSGGQSLGLIFEGNYDSSLPLVRQTVVVEKNRSYKLSFAYRTRKLTSGSLPVVQLILKQKDNDEMFREIKLVENSGEWINHSVTIETGNQDEALEIRLARQNCKETLCPIFGRMWLDAFVFEQSPK